MVRRTHVIHIGFFVLIACGSLLTSCRDAVIIEDREAFGCAADFSLEVVNNASDQIRIQIEMSDSSHWSQTIISADGSSYARRSGIVNLDSNEKLRFSALSIFYGECGSPANFHLRDIGAVSFYEAGADIPYRGYVYLAFGCGVDLAVCEEFDDDTLIFHRSSDGATEDLFVESPDRPFYLERDKDDPALGRLVVTFVPSSAPDAAG